ncbi:MAG: VCBS repeat-containing protein [Verrucomicrobia bacterium]|nr:VCBS repeat-containing protein [Verrucomicrobiota bacterium]
MKTHLTGRARSVLLGSTCCLLLVASGLDAQLFDTLKSLSPRLPVGDPALPASSRGPKSIAAADLDGDGLSDLAVSDKSGSVTLYYSNGSQGFSAPIILQVENAELRAIIAVDVNHDGKIDLLVASPFTGKVHVLLNQGGRKFEDHPFPAWVGARDLAVGDFNGDGTPDLAVAGPNMGLRQYEGLGDGTFASVVSFPEVDGGACGTGDDLPQPAYFLQSFRAPTQTRDSLVIAHGQGCARLWVLGSPPSGQLAILSTLSNLDVNAIAVGPILNPVASGIPDLVTSSLDGGYVEVRALIASTGTFADIPAQRIPISGGPRSLRMVDWDRDGWNDLAVVIRFFDRVTLYTNTAGQLKPGASVPVGHLPREMDIGDFNGDQQMDLAVVNRYSLDVTVVPGFLGQASFASLDQVYPVDGTVTGLSVRDYNNDGRADVVQLHIASGELSVRLSGADGHLAAPVFYPLGVRPSAQAVTDVNNDKQPDIVAVDLSGSVSVRLGQPDGTFGPEQRYVLPASLGGSLYAVVAADFDNDGNIDLAAGYTDCRLIFLRGDGHGNFTPAGDYDHPLYFGYEARSMAAADLDGDGDLDLVGAGMDGKITVVENEGNLLTTHRLKLKTFDSPGLQDIRSIEVLDENKDGDWDLFVTGPSGNALFLGGKGLEFSLAEKESFKVDVSGTASVMGDFDGDGKVDLAVADSHSNTLSLFVRKNDSSPWELALITAVPSAAFLASGDIDGDGKPDLVGSGEVLWTALSSRRSRVVPSAGEETGHAVMDQVVINEFLASNLTLPLDADGGRTSDWIELFNGSSVGLGLQGWSLQLIRETAPGESTTNTFAFPATAVLNAKGRLMVVAADKKRTPLHTGFAIPAEGGTLVLRGKQGQVVDRVDYPAQDADHSYCRFRDGARGWVVNPFPSPNQPNLDNGTAAPKLSFEGIDAPTARPGIPVRFRAKGRDDLGITTISVHWHRLDIQESVDHRAILFDDGLHGDGASQDGSFSGTLEAGLPAGARIQFYLQASDLTDKSIYAPFKPEQSLAVADRSLFTLSIEAAPTTLEISEVVPSNKNGLKDEAGRNPDWVEIRNIGVEKVELDGVKLAKKPYGADRYAFPKGLSLGPGDYAVVFCDAGRTPGIWHASFELDPGGDELFLLSVDGNGDVQILDNAKFGAVGSDIAWARPSAGAPLQILSPTPYASNRPGLWIGLLGGRAELILGTMIGEIYHLETSPTLTPAAWKTVLEIAGDGHDVNMRLDQESARFYRLR